MLTLSASAIDNRDAARLGCPPNAATKAPGEAHQVGVIQTLIRPIELPPESGKAGGRGAMAVVSVEHDAIDAVVLPIEEIRQRLGQRVGHFASLGLELPRQGPLVRGASPRTSVASLKDAG